LSKTVIPSSTEFVPFFLPKFNALYVPVAMGGHLLLRRTVIGQ
jgi:hypothetical protein